MIEAKLLDRITTLRRASWGGCHHWGGFEPAVHPVFEHAHHPVSVRPDGGQAVAVGVGRVRGEVALARRPAVDPESDRLEGGARSAGMHWRGHENDRPGARWDEHGSDANCLVTGAVNAVDDRPGVSQGAELDQPALVGVAADRPSRALFNLARRDEPPAV